MKTSYFELLYDGIILEQCKLSKEFSFEEMKNMLIKRVGYFVEKFHEITLSMVFFQDILLFRIDLKKSYLIKEITEMLSIKLSGKILKIIRYLDVLAALYEFNDNLIDNYVIKDKMLFPVNYVEIITERMYILSKSFLKNYCSNESFFVYVFFIRDLIESIKLYLLFLNSDSETIQNKLSIENQNWNLDTEKLIKGNKDLILWLDELREINKINSRCNNYIHKNGLTKISPKYGRSIATNIDWLDDWYKIIKIYFILIACQDGKSISSSDYIDYLDMGMTPPEDCQYRVASIFEDFLKTEFSIEEIDKIISKSYMHFNI